MMIESGMDVTIALDPSAVHNLAQAHEARLERAGPRRPICDALPSCDRWGDANANAPLYMSTANRVARSDVLAHESRATLPMATRLAPSGKRTAPGASMGAEFESRYVPVRTYAQLSQGCAPSVPADLTDAAAAGAADPKALQIDAERSWPPRALGAAFDASGVVGALRGICEALEAQPERTRRTNGPGTYSKLFRKSLATLDDTTARDVLGLSIGAFERDPRELLCARKNAMHAAMASHVCGQPELAVQLERLGDGIAGLGRESS